jgi:hypothetical protein
MKENKEIVYACRLLSYSDKEAVAALPRQLNLLKLLAASTAPGIALTYRLWTDLNESGVRMPCFDVICDVDGSVEIEELRRGFGNMLAATFRSAYELRGLNEQTIADSKTGAMRRGCVVVPAKKSEEGFDANIFVGSLDWSFFMDMLRSQPTSIVLDLTLQPIEKREGGKIIYQRPGKHANDFSVEGSKEAAEFFNSMTEQFAYEDIRLDLSITLRSNADIPDSVVDCIGGTMSGGLPYETYSINSRRKNKRGNPMSALHVIKLFHAPFGEVTRTVGRKQRTTALYLEDTSFENSDAYCMSLGPAVYRTILSDERIDVSIPERDRLRHMYVLGKSGGGKTNFMKNCVRQDVKYCDGSIIIIDAHGDLADDAIRNIPKGRWKDVILLDLTNKDYLPCINPLDIDRSDRALVARIKQETSDILSRMGNHEWTGFRWRDYHNHIVDTLLDPGYPYPASLIDIQKLFMDQEHRKKIISLLKNEALKQWWMMEVNNRSNDHTDTLQWVNCKYSPLADDHILRTVLGGDHSTVNIEDIICGNKILIVKIPAAVIGEATADLIGSLIILQLKNAIMRRKLLAADTREALPNHFIYVDEFQSLAGNFETFAQMLSEARKFGIGLMLANQNLDQLRQLDRYTSMVSRRMLDSILGNVGSIVAFGLGNVDAEMLAPKFDVPPAALMNIGRYEAVAKILVDGQETKAFTLMPSEAVASEDEIAARTILHNNKEIVLIPVDRTLHQIESRFKPKEAKEKKTPSADREIADMIAELPSTGTETGKKPQRSSFLDEWLAKRAAGQDKKAQDNG